MSYPPGPYEGSPGWPGQQPGWQGQPPQQPPPPPGWQGPQPGWQGQQPGWPGQLPPDNYLVWAILTTLFCCLPTGIVSIVYSTKVSGLWTQGQYAEAQTASDNAKKWAIISAVVGSRRLCNPHGHLFRIHRGGGRAPALSHDHHHLPATER